MKDQHEEREITVLNAVPDERFGGPQHRVLQVAKRLKGKDINTVVVMPCGDNAFPEMLNDAGITFFQLRSFRRLPNPSNLPGIIYWLWYFFPCMFTIAKLIRKYHVDIVHVNGGLNIQVSLAAKFSRAKLLWHLNDVRNPKLLKLTLLVLFRVLPDKVVVASTAVEECYYGKNNAAEKMEVLYPPVDTSRFYPDEITATKYRHELRIQPEEKVVGIVGNINPFKGYEYFLQAARLIKQEIENVKFLVVGEKLATHERYWQNIRSLLTDLDLEEDVIFTGHRTDICEILNLMDVFVLSSIHEAAPIVVLEAMACAKPIVATNVGGVPELVVDGETGIVVPPRDSKAVAVAVLRLLDQPEKAIQMGLNARNRAIECFDLDICAGRHNDIYCGMY